MWRNPYQMYGEDPVITTEGNTYERTAWCREHNVTVDLQIQVKIIVLLVSKGTKMQAAVSVTSKISLFFYSNRKCEYIEDGSVITTTHTATMKFRFEAAHYHPPLPALNWEERI
eukprot:PhF_6_TR20212/c0_g1_i1/m.29294